ncbi:MAG: hypothetical protein WDW38_000440 [Sanguina aurantia]
MGSPARRLLLEFAPLSYLFGNTPAEDLFSGSPPAGDRKVLLLGCGDVRNTLRTIAQFPAGHALELHLNDSNDAVLARAALLLSVVQRMDPGSASEVEYLWDITYNLNWSSSSNTAERFAADVTRLLDGDLGCCTVAEAGKDPISASNDTFEERPNLEALRSIWSYWLRALETAEVHEVQQRRSDHILAWRSKRHSHDINNSSGPHDEDAYLHSWSALKSYTMLHPGSDLQATLDIQALFGQFQIDYLSWHRHGTICSPADPPPLNSSQSSTTQSHMSSYSVASQSQHSSGWVNPTLLQPHTGQYSLHYAADPFEPFLPLPDAVVRESIAALKWSARLSNGSSSSQGNGPSESSSSSSRAGSKGAVGSSGPHTGSLLTHICMTLMAQAAAAAQKRLQVVSTNGPKTAPVVLQRKGAQLPLAAAAAASGRISVVLHRGDALELCLGSSTIKQPHGTVDTGSSLAPGAVFDIIHTSNLADYVSLTNLLLAARPRLNAARPGSRILTQSMLWPTLADTQRAYLATSLCAEPELYPTLYGLRLTTDLDNGLHTELQRLMAQPPSGMHFFDCITAITCLEVSAVEKCTITTGNTGIMGGKNGHGGSGTQNTSSASSTAPFTSPALNPDTPPPPSHNSSSAAAPLCKHKTKRASNTSQSPGSASMTVSALYESPTAFTASISITLPPKCLGSASGLTITSDSSSSRPPAALGNGVFHPHDPADPAAECAHEVRVGIARPVPISLTLNLPWPVSAGSVNAKLSKSTGTISLVLPKAQEWPQDWTVPGVVQQVGP